MDKTNRMLIDATHPEETRVVVLREGRVEEFDYESASRKPLRGNIYLAKVTRVEPSLQAAFVDYGGNRHGFLAFSEIHPDYYQIPVADRQALLDEEAAADAEAEAEADARAEAESRRHPDDASSGRVEDEAGGEGDRDAPIRAAHAAEHEHVRQGDAPTREAGSENGRIDNGNGHDRGDDTGEDHVEEIAGDPAEAPETVGSVEQVGSEDAMEEVPERPRRRMRSYKIQEVIKRRQIILVQVVKEERGNKGAALTTYLSLAGRYTVLMPNTGRGGGISRKITNPQDRKRLKSIAHELEVPDGMGLIIRTAGAARTKQEIKRDFEYEIRLWENVRDMTLKSTAPCLVYEEGNLIKRSIRDLYAKDIEEIAVAGEAAHTEAVEFMKMLSPSQVKNVAKYDGPEPLFLKYQIERQLNAMFSPFVTLRSGGYLVINQTEALVAVDVNSGKSTREFSIEETALNTNLEAAEEISRQLKLRDLAGLIVIDFIDMEEKRNNRAVERRLKDCLRHDRARIQVGRISHFGLLEMSRQRLRTGVLEGSTSQCPHCQGTGIIRSVESVALAVLRAIEDNLLRDARHSLNVVTTAEVALYILNNKRSFVTAMETRYGITIAVKASDRMQGANFAIEKAAPALAPKAPERSAVNMDWGFEGQEGQEEPEDAEIEEAGAPAERSAPGRDEEGGEGRRPRRRRRRGRRDGGEDRGPRADHRNGGAEPNGSGKARAADDDEPRRDDGQPAADFQELQSDPDATRDPPRRATPDDFVSEGDDRPGRRGRRRGRRGGRRGRERGDAPRQDAGGEGFSADAAHEPSETMISPDAAAGNGGPAPHRSHDDAEHAAEPVAEASRHSRAEVQSPQPETRIETIGASDASEPAWRIPSVQSIAVPAEPPARAAPVAEQRLREMEAAEPAPEPAQEDAIRPIRKGWWQRRFSGE